SPWRARRPGTPNRIGCAVTKSSAPRTSWPTTSRATPGIGFQADDRAVIVRLSEAPPEQLGGKAAGLARLAGLGLPVPPTVVVPIDDDGVLDDPRGLVGDLGEPLAVRSSAVGEDATGRSAAGQFESLLGVTADGLAEAVR